MQYDIYSLQSHQGPQIERRTTYELRYPSPFLFKYINRTTDDINPLTIIVAKVSLNKSISYLWLEDIILRWRPRKVHQHAFTDHDIQVACDQMTCQSAIIGWKSIIIKILE